jgi:hypothetical protein
VTFLAQSSKKQSVVEVKRSTVRMFVKPKRAQEWLDSNTRNRPLMESLVDVYARDMRDGRWQENGDAIRFDREGVLLDGQHRLQACVKSGAGFWTDVAYGLDPECFQTIDGGSKRKVSQVAAMMGITNATIVSAAASYLWTHENYSAEQIGCPRYTPTRTQHEEVIVKTRPLLEASATATRGFPRKFATPAILCFCHYLFTQDNRAAAERFFSDLKSGVNLSLGCPARLLRERLTALATDKAKLPTPEILALIFKAWIAYRGGKQLRKLQWKSTGKSPESFPEVKYLHA